jgi:hypothetical protein
VELKSMRRGPRTSRRVASTAADRCPGRQVGIVALNLIGEPLVPAPPPPPGGGAAYLDVGQQPVGEVGYYNR